MEYSQQLQMSGKSIIIGYNNGYYKFNIVGFCRSYGVVIWEITSYGDAPLDDMEAKDIVEAAQDGTLQHPRSVL